MAVSELTALVESVYRTSTAKFRSKLLSTFVEWISGKDNLKALVTDAESPLEFWQKAERCSTNWQPIRNLLERFAITAASEADCERKLSRMKLLVESVRGSMSAPTMHSLLMYLKSASPQ
jgi:hypothetical protein